MGGSLGRHWETLEQTGWQGGVWGESAIPVAICFRVSGPRAPVATPSSPPLPMGENSATREPRCQGAGWRVDPCGDRSRQRARRPRLWRVYLLTPALRAVETASHTVKAARWPTARCVALETSSNLSEPCLALSVDHPGDKQIQKLQLCAGGEAGKGERTVGPSRWFLGRKPVGAGRELHVLAHELEPRGGARSWELQRVRPLPESPSCWARDPTRGSLPPHGSVVPSARTGPWQRQPGCHSLCHQGSHSPAPSSCLRACCRRCSFPGKCST